MSALAPHPNFRAHALRPCGRRTLCGRPVLWHWRPAGRPVDCPRCRAMGAR